MTAAVVRGRANTRRWIFVAAAVLGLLLLAWYLASPWLAARDLQSALERGDQDRLEELVDFPAVRDSLKTELMATMNEAMANDPEMQNNPFSGLATVMLPGLVNSAVDAYVTPGGLANLSQGRRPNQTDGGAESTNDPVVDLGYRNLDTFVASFREAEGASRFSFVLRRQGFAGWQMKRVELPDDLAERDADPSTPATQ